MIHYFKYFMTAAAIGAAMSIIQHTAEAQPQIDTSTSNRAEVSSLDKNTSAINSVPLPDPDLASFVHNVNLLADSLVYSELHDDAFKACKDTLVLCANRQTDSQTAAPMQALSTNHQTSPQAEQALPHEQTLGNMVRPWHTDARVHRLCQKFDILCGTKNSPESSRTDTHKKDEYSSAFADNSQETQSAWADTIEEFAQNICASWPGQRCSAFLPPIPISNHTHTIDTIGQTVLSSLGFKLDKSTEILAISASAQTADLIAAASDDPVLLTMLRLQKTLAEYDGIAVENILAPQIDQLFSSSDTKLSNSQKTLILAAFLPLLIQHAESSGDIVSARKLRQTMHTLNIHQRGEYYGIACTACDEESGLDITVSFDLQTLHSGGKASASGIMRPLIITPDGQNLVPDSSAPLSCNSVLIHSETRTCRADLENDILKTFIALSEKDSEGIALGMADITNGLACLNAQYGYVASWNNHWDNAPIEDWMCRLQTIELLAIEQDRFVELMRLNAQLAEIFAGTAFYSRLLRYENCENQLNPPFNAAYSRLMEDHQSEYTWLAKNFAPKAKKNLQKAFDKWTHKIKSNIALRRRLLAMWTAWSEGNYKQAANFAGDIAAKKTMNAHPQLHSLNLILNAIRGDTIDRDRFEQYARIVSLKMPSLIFLTLSEASRWLTHDQKRTVIEVIRKYPVGLAPNAAAVFYKTYEKEFREILTPSQKMQFNAWLDVMRPIYESPQKRIERRFVLLEDLAEFSSPSAIVQVIDTFTKDTSIQENERILYNDLLNSLKSAEDMPPHANHSPRQQCMESISRKSALETMRDAHKCWAEHGL